MTNPESLNKVKDIILNINDEKYPYLQKIIVENKADISPETSKEEIQKFFVDYSNLVHISISVKTGYNIDNLLNKIYEENNSTRNNLIPINQVAKSTFKIKQNEESKTSISLILVGNSQVGKTNLMGRYAKNAFQTLFISSIGILNERKKIKINNKEICHLTLWDTAGQERFMSLPRKYYRNVDGVLLLFDLQNKESFTDISKWMDEINDYSGTTDEVEEEKNDKSRRPIVYLIGNKIDLLYNKEVEITQKEKNELIKKIGVKYYEISCKWNLNVEEVMARIILECYKINRPREKIIQITKITNSNREGCCLGKNNNKKNQ